MSEELKVRLVTVRGEAKARDVWDRARAQIKRHLTIAEMHDGSWRVFGIRLTVDDLWRFLGIGAAGIERVEPADGRPHIAEWVGAAFEKLPGSGRARAPEMKRNAEGDLEAPPGETFIYCGECGASRFFMTMADATGAPRRLTCCRCGNEVRFYHAAELPPEGRA